MEKPMTTVKLSPKFQIVIPKVIRERMSLRPGRKLKVLQYEDRIELIPIGPMRKLFGMAKGIDTTVERDEDRA
jgi:AbrB family looped-hinge helix DNA binding protein